LYQLTDEEGGEADKSFKKAGERRFLKRLTEIEELYYLPFKFLVSRQKVRILIILGRK